jgi:vacuolar-type H+-ATPase subunit H
MSDQTTQGGGPEGATAVKEQASEAASTAVAKTSEVAGTATEGARQVASEASRQASQLTSEALTSARNLVGEATGSLREQADQQTERAASGVRSLAEQMRALAEGRTDEAGAAGDYARQAGDKLQQVADRLQSGGLEGALSDLQGFARRRPGVFLLGAAAAGFAVGRLVRGAQAASSDGNGAGTGSAELPAGDLRLGRTDGPLTTTSTLGPEPATVAPPPISEVP